MQTPIECSICKKTHLRIVKSESICITCYARTRKKNCKTEGCTKKEYCQGHCQSHYNKEIENGTIKRREVKVICSFDGCCNKSFALKLCNKHYRQEKKGKLGFNNKEPSNTIKDSRILTKWQKEKIRTELKNNELREQFLRNPIGKINENIKFYRFDAHELSKLAKIPIGLFGEVLNHLKEDEQILDFTYDKKLMVVEIKIPNDIELSFTVNLNQKPDDVLF